jgi:hypothetical protein
MSIIHCGVATGDLDVAPAFELFSAQPHNISLHHFSGVATARSVAQTTTGAITKSLSFQVG